MRKFGFALSLLIVFLTPLAFGQNAITKNQKEIAITRIKALIDSNYVFPERVEHVNNALENLVMSGKYDEITDYQGFAAALTEDLFKITNDKHFVVNFNPEFIQGRRERLTRTEEASESAIEEPRIDWNWWFGLQDNLGFQKVEVLDGNIGYIKINFFQPLDWVRPKIDAAMSFIASTDGLIIDLTGNGGGYSPTDSYLGSFFFKAQPKIWMSSYDRPSGETTSVSTISEIGAEPYLNKPVIVLIDEKTFSLGEQFAYAMKHFDRAIIVGQVSAGAAHAINFMDIDDNIGLQIPVQKSIHPVTKTDWEGTGVQPDKVTSKDQNLSVAYLTLLDILMQNAEYDRQKERYRGIKTELTK